MKRFLLLSVLLTMFAVSDRPIQEQDETKTALVECTYCEPAGLDIRVAEVAAFDLEVAETGESMDAVAPYAVAEEVELISPVDIRPPILNHRSALRQTTLWERNQEPFALAARYWRSEVILDGDNKA